MSGVEVPEQTSRRGRAAADAPRQVLRGFLMGSADIVPGVSGGTIALVLGIYRRLVANIQQASAALGRAIRLDLAATRRAFGRVEWLWLIPLLVGIALAVITLARVIDTLLEEQPVRMAAVFFGLVAASSLVAWRLLATRGRNQVGILLVVGAVVFVALGFGGGEVSDPSIWLFFPAGALAICAMILPGVSGSFLLLTVGMYEPLLDAVVDRDLGVLLVFLTGCVVGLALFSSLLHWALETHYNTVMAGLVGLMLGSLRVLWPWPEGTDSTSLGVPPADDWWIPVALAVLAAAVVLAISATATRREQRERLVDTYDVKR